MNTLDRTEIKNVEKDNVIMIGTSKKSPDIGSGLLFN